MEIYLFRKEFFMAKRIINTVFVAVILIFLIIGLAKTVFFPKDINDLENRKANKMPTFSVQEFLDGNFQKDVRSALSDQVFFAQSMKKLYNTVDSLFVKISVSTVASVDAFNEVPQYITVDNMNLYGKNYDHILYNPTVFDWVKDMLDTNISGFNGMINNLGDAEVYLYYIEKETDINFVTGEKSNVFEYISENLAIPDTRKDRFEVTDFEDFSECFYRTDHHWNDEGSYRGYLELLKLLNISDAPIKRGERVLLGSSFAGSKTQSPGLSTFKENFYARKYEYPFFLTVQNGIATDDYGLQNEYFDKKDDLAPITYGNFYGGDMGEIIFDTGDISKDSILVLGESFDNAILKLLASHFHKTHSIDMRYYKSYMEKDFDISEYMKKHDIDKILLIGNIDFFISEEFVPEY